MASIAPAGALGLQGALSRQAVPATGTLAVLQQQEVVPNPIKEQLSSVAAYSILGTIAKPPASI
jgi:hypothetical protein